MAILRRGAKLPDSVRTSLDGAKPLAWAALRDGRHVVAVADGVVIVTDDGVSRRLSWHLLDGAEWDNTTDTLTLREVGGATLPLRLAGDPQRFAQAVRERIEASLVHLVQRDLAGGVSVRAAVRRDPAGALTSQVSVVGAARNDPELLALATELEREARAAVGLPD